VRAYISVALGCRQPRCHTLGDGRR
jgi:hypothetical protein